MNEIIQQDNRYPEWLKAWNAKVTEIDQQIIDFFQGKPVRTPEQLSELNTHMQGWWDRQDLDAITKAQYQEVLRDQAFRKQVEARVKFLEAERKFEVAKKQIIKSA